MKTAIAAESWCFETYRYKDSVLALWRLAGKIKGLNPFTGAAPLFRRIVRRTFSRFIHVIFLKFRGLAARREDAETMTIKAGKTICINGRNLGQAVFKRLPDGQKRAGYRRAVQQRVRDVREWNECCCCSYLFSYDMYELLKTWDLPDLGFKITRSFKKLQLKLEKSIHQH